MKKVNMYQELKNRYIIWYFYYEINKNHFWIYSVNFDLSEWWIFVKPIDYISDWSWGEKNEINYNNKYWEYAIDFLKIVSLCSYKLTKKQFYFKWDFWVKNMRESWKRIKENIIIYNNK